MAFFYNSLSSIWNTTASYLSAPANYCRDNNISWTTIGNLAEELASIAVGVTLATADKANDALASMASATTELAWMAKTSAAQSAYSELENDDPWQFGTTAQASAEKSSSDLIKEMAASAGTQVLNLGHTALSSAYATLSSTAAQLGTSAWAGIQVSAPALSATLLSGIQFIAGQTTAALADQGPLLLRDNSTIELSQLGASVQHSKEWHYLPDFDALPVPPSPFSVSVDASSQAPGPMGVFDDNGLGCSSQGGWDAGQASLIGVMLCAY